MRTDNTNKRIESQAIARDVEQFLINGGQIKTLPGFGIQPTIVDGRRFSLNTLGQDNSLSADIDQGIIEDLLAGMTTTQVARKWRVGTTTVTIRRDKLLARGEL
jgi:hypothetical protein